MSTHAKEAYEALDAVMTYIAEHVDGLADDFMGETLLVQAVQKVRDAYSRRWITAEQTLDRWLREQQAGIREVPS
jgi:hypothetical protein